MSYTRRRHEVESLNVFDRVPAARLDDLPRRGLSLYVSETAAVTAWTIYSKPSSLPHNPPRDVHRVVSRFALSAEQQVRASGSIQRRKQ